jgi:NADH dehydrogenase
VLAALGRRLDGHARFELAGPEVLTYDGIVRVALRAFGRRRRLLHLPLPLVRGGLRGLETLARDRIFATWEEAELMEIPMLSDRGTADAESLGVNPLRMGAVLGAA